MRKLNCSSCGGTLSLTTTAEGHVVGGCGNCGSEYLIDAKGRQHVVVEHRFPQGRGPVGGPVAAAPVRGRRLLIGAGIGAACVVGLAPLFGGALFGPSRQGRAPETPFREIFNVGGEGATPGQFRADPFEVAVDSLDRAVVRDQDQRYYIFGPDGRFLNNYPRPLDGNGTFVALLPNGDLILSHRNDLARADMETGEVRDVIAGPEDMNDWIHGAAECVTPDGGIALYRVPDRMNPDRRSMGDGSSLPGADVVIFLDRNLRETHRLSNLLPQAIAADPMIGKAPRPISIAINGNGSVFIYVIPSEDHDSRTGIFEFNAAGRFQRRIAVEQKYHGAITMAPDGSLWLQDSWMSKLQRVLPEGVLSYETAGLGRTRGEAPGNIYSVAPYRDGSLALIGNQRFIRAAPLDAKS